MFCDTLLAFQSIQVQEVQWCGCFVSNVEEHGGKVSLKARTNTRRLISTYLVNYASSLIIPTNKPKDPFYTSPDIIDSVLLMWDIKFTTINLTYYKN